MKVLKCFFVLTFSIFSNYTYSQNKDSVDVLAKSTNIVLSYNSSLIYPGFNVGAELPIKTLQVNKIKKSGKSKVIRKDNFITTKISWYHHPTFHDNVYFTVGWTMKRTHLSGFLTDFSPAIGLSRTFLGGTTYQDNIMLLLLLDMVLDMILKKQNKVP
jgi:hypothetical protein